MAKKRLQKWLAFCLAVSMLMGTTAMAADTTGQVAVETRGGKKEAVNVVIKVEKNGKTTRKTETAENFETESGMIVDYTGSSEMNDDGTGTAQSEYTVEQGDYSAEGGSEITAEKQAPGKITVDVPLTSEEGKNQNTVMGDKAGTIVDIDGKPKTSENDGTYDYTQTVIKEQGSVSVETEKITVTETINGNGSKMEQVVSETTPDADNDLMRQAGSPLSKDLPDAAPADGYEYVFIGTGNSSQFWASYLYKTPGYEGEQPVYTDADGNSYYDHNRNDPNSGHKYYVEGLYVNGEQVVE
ncbi:MAG: hypothetical protein IJ452_04190, partial [Butyricicoccus sp.]|nr:hypothetical protein [Butyricicoccus sp.]